MIHNDDDDEQVYKDVGSNDQHNAYDADVANSFYNLATEFYEYGWGDSFHFGFRHKNEPHSKAIANSQNFVAAKLQVRRYKEASVFSSQEIAKN